MSSPTLPIVFFITDSPTPTPPHPTNNNQFFNFLTSTGCPSDTESQPLYTGTELNLRERVWVKQEKIAVN